MMLRFTMWFPNTKDPGDLLLDPHYVTAVVEGQIKDGPKVARLIGHANWVVWDEDRSAMRRVAEAKGEMIDPDPSCD